MRWEDERYVRLFVRDTTTWKMLPWQGKCLIGIVMRKLDRAGVLDLGDDGWEGLAALTDMPLEVVEIGMESLIKRGVFALAGSRLVMPNFLHAQECSQSDKARKAAQRERERAQAVADAVTKRDATVTERDAESQNVTKSHEQSHAVTASHTESLRAVPCSAVPSSAVPPIAPQGGGAAVRVFDHWRTAMRSPRSVLDPKRRRLIEQRLEQFSEADLCTAIDGCRADPFSMGDNDRHKPFNGVSVIFRDAEHVEKFMALAPQRRPDAPKRDDVKPADPAKVRAFKQGLASLFDKEAVNG